MVGLMTQKDKAIHIHEAYPDHLVPMSMMDEPLESVPLTIKPVLEMGQKNAIKRYRRSYTTRGVQPVVS